MRFKGSLWRKVALYLGFACLLVAALMRPSDAVRPSTERPDPPNSSPPRPRDNEKGAILARSVGLLFVATVALCYATRRLFSLYLGDLSLASLSTALLGYGTSGVVLALWQGLRERAALDRMLGLLALVFGVLTVGGFWLIRRVVRDGWTWSP